MSVQFHALQATAPRLQALDGRGTSSLTHTVQSGETLSAIAKKYGTSVDTLMKANPQIRNADVVYVGDRINVPTQNVNYSVRPGDSLAKIAAAHGTTADAIAKANNIQNPNMIYPGDTLRIPAGGTPGTPPAQRPAEMPRAPAVIITPPRVPAPPAQNKSPVSSSSPQITPGQLPITTGLSEAQKHDLYAGHINTFGSDAAKQDLADGKKVVLSLRVDTDTNASQGKGVYDDRMVVVWQDKNGMKHAKEFKANADPSGQYEDGGRYMRKVDGMDFNGDGRRDLGRLVDGTYSYVKGTHQGKEAYRATGDQRTERDTDHNGKFDDSAQSKRASNYGMHIHVGGNSNTYSAGCATMPPAEFNEFLRLMADQRTLTNVLVNTNRL